MVQPMFCFEAFLRWISIHSPWRKSDEFHNFTGQKRSKENLLVSNDDARPLHPDFSGDGSGGLLWMHANPSSTQMWDFMQYAKTKYKQDFKTYAALHRWSIENPVDSWGAIWEFCGVRHSRAYVKVIDPAAATRMWPRPSWFEGATLNFAENLLYPTREVEDNSIAMDYEVFLGLGESSHKLFFTQLPAEQPVYILYSSGTTGAPKCIVHGAIGTLIQHKKEHMLQSDIRPGDRLFYFTTCMWMMWHWHVSALSSGVTLVIYDGSPFYFRHNGRAVEDYLAMPKLIDELGINQFGTSAKFLSVLQQNAVKPRDEGVSLETLKAIYSTGSPLAPATFRYVYQEFGPGIHLGSISGGTDIIADFGTPCPLQPVHAGEIQVLGLGMAVQAWAQDGQDISNSGLPGELVCVKPFPSQPVRFWGPSGLQKYEDAYFKRFPGQWHHGDFIRFNHETGGIYMLGRSDGTLNPSGVRFGSAEIYNLLLSNFSAVIDDSLCVGRTQEHETDETVILFIKIKCDLELTSQLIGQIKKVIWDQLSPRHVPHLVVECPDIPYTHNNKKVELAVKQIVSGLDTKPTASIANADCLGWYREWAIRN